eukprot:TRINITY_DN6867_c1_g1_i1.p1 TRINITY_DN6867_c1_g1~~TRINITY_DN6867_c1_g1_i1.p1  ORF type:complete len:177 (+),score=31.35 TRINITY_DN6867_c1_g1_i1:97-627(+)
MSGNPTNACGVKEIAVAAKYIVQLCDTTGLSPAKVGLFRDALVRALMTKYQGHWWSERGQAYRSLLHDQYSCPRLVLNAADESGIQDILSRLPSTPFCMWVDPHHVAVRNMVSGQTHVLYDENPALVASSGRVMSAKSRAFAPSGANCATEYATSFVPSFETMTYHQMLGASQHSN